MKIMADILAEEFKNRMETAIRYEPLEVAHDFWELIQDIAEDWVDALVTEATEAAEEEEEG